MLLLIRICPIIDLLRLIGSMKHCKPDTVLFTWANGDFVTTHLLRSMLKKVAAKIGINPDTIGNHTTRKTCIQHAIACGVPDTVLVQLGRWRSFQSLRAYIDLRPVSLINIRTNAMNFNQSSADRFKLFAYGSNGKF